MPQWLIKLFHSLGRKQAAKRTGIAQIPTQIDAEGTGAAFYTTLREAGFTDEALTKLIKSEKDIIRLVNKVESMQNQNLKNMDWKKQIEGLGKKKPFEGFTPKIVPKDKTLLKDSPEAIAKIKAENKAAVERLKAKKKTVEDFTKDDDWDPSGMASGGIAGQLHLNQGGRIGYESGKKVWPPKGPNPDGSFDPGSLPKNFINKMPLMDPRLRDLIKEYKKRKGLAEILGV